MSFSQGPFMDENHPNWSMTNTNNTTTNSSTSTMKETNPDLSSLPLSSSSVEQRLLEIKKTVQKATEEALQRTDPSTEQVLQSDNKNASFHLGMELFGSDPAHIEQTIQQSLSQMERKLKDLLIEVQVRETRDFAANEDGTDNNNNNHSDAVKLGASVLQFKIRFLKQCSQVRQWVDEAIALSDPSFSSGSSSTSGSTLPQTTAGSAQNDWVRAIRKLGDAEQEWKRIHQMILDYQATQNHTATPQEVQELEKAQHMVQLLRHDIRTPKVQILSQIQSLWQNCMTLEHETLRVRGFQSPSTDSPALLEQIYNVLQVLEEEQNHTLLQELLLPLASKLYKDVIGPVLETHRKGAGVVCWEFHELQERGSASSGASMPTSTWSRSAGPVKTLEWARDEEKTTEKDPVVAWSETFQFMQRILVFVSENVLLNRPHLCQMFGQRLLGKPVALQKAGLNLHELGLESFRLAHDDGLLMGPLVDVMMDTCIPDFVAPGDLYSLRDTQARLQEVVGPFLQSMHHHNLLSDSQDCQLRHFVDSFLEKYIHHRHGLKLGEARSLILNRDYHNTKQVGVLPSAQDKEDKELGLDNGLDEFRLQRSCVSEIAFDLYELCVASLDEAVEYATALEQTSDPALADLPASLYHASRQVLDLYRSIVPVRHGKEVAQVPRTTAIFYNDCVYMAHHCLSLGLRYREQFPESGSHNALRRVCIFLDKVPLFREMADRSMREMLDKQALEIQGLVKARLGILSKALRSQDIVAEWADAETALNAGLYHIRHVAQQWKPILSQKIFDATIGHLSNILFTLFLEPILAAKDFSSEACEFVHNLFGKALDEVHLLLEGRVGGVQAWDRFRAIGRYMDMSLNDVEAALSEGVFARVTGQELTHLVLATFDESPRRQDLLRILNKAS